jgi:hypothetical protein
MDAYLESNTVAELSFDGVAVYRICVRGRPIARWCEQLLGLSVHLTPHPEDAEITVLEGQVADQGALIGVLVALYDMQLPVVGVQYLGTHGRHP